MELGPFSTLLKY